MSKKTALITSIISIAILAVILTLLVIGYDFDNGDGSCLVIFDGEQEIASYEISYLQQSNLVVSLDAHLKESGRPVKKVQYTGIALSQLLDDTQGIVAINSTAYDGVVKSYSANQLEGLFVVFMQQGQYIKHRDDGGYGPMMIVDVNSAFSQGWCKYLARIDIIRG